MANPFHIPAPDIAAATARMQVDMSPLQKLVQQQFDREQEQHRRQMQERQFAIQKAAADRQAEEYARQGQQREAIKSWAGAQGGAGVPKPLTDLAGITGDPSGVQSYVVAEAKRKAALADPEGFGKAGTLIQNADGTFSVIQLGERGNLRTHQLGQGASPARGVTIVGDEAISNSTAQTIRKVGDQLTGGEVAKGEGKNIAKVRAELPEARQRLDLIGGGLRRLKGAATALRDHKGLKLVAGGLYQAHAPNLSEDARNAGTLMTNLKNQISGVVLQSMRDASKTGGAVGQVTEREWPRLENMIANLDPSQGIEQFKVNLAAVISYADEVYAAIQRAYEADVAVASRGAGYGGTPQAQGPSPVRVNSPDEARRLPSGTPIILPDGSEGRVP